MNLLSMLFDLTVGRMVDAIEAHHVYLMEAREERDEKAAKVQRRKAERHIESMKKEADLRRQELVAARELKAAAQEFVAFEKEQEQVQRRSRSRKSIE